MNAEVVHDEVGEAWSSDWYKATLLAAANDWSPCRDVLATILASVSRRFVIAAILGVKIRAASLLIGVSRPEAKKEYEVP